MYLPLLPLTPFHSLNLSSIPSCLPVPKISAAKLQLPIPVKGHRQVLLPGLVCRQRVGRGSLPATANAAPRVLQSCWVLDGCTGGRWWGELTLLAAVPIAPHLWLKHCWHHRSMQCLWRLMQRLSVNMEGRWRALLDLPVWCGRCLCRSPFNAASLHLYQAALQDPPRA